MSLPSGNVTFLFTDIEGSTQSWEQHPETMRSALQRHDDLLYAVIHQQNGYVFKTVGDAFYAAFETPLEALAAAVSAQSTLLTEDWGVLPLRVRIAIHTGSAEMRNGDYFGPTLNRVARLLSAGHGEQVLLSSATAELIRGGLPQGASLRDLGTHWLKDLQQPEHVYQLLHPGLPAGFPPLRSLQTLAEEPTSVSLIGTGGHGQEIATVSRILSRTRLLTLTGAAGADEARFALQVGTNVAEQYGDGVWLVDLAFLEDPDLLPQAVARALGLEAEAGQPLLQTIIDYLRPRTLLLVWNHCEYPLSVHAALAGTLLSTCPYLRILASSREEFGLNQELSYHVPSLWLRTQLEKMTARVLSLPENVLRHPRYRRLKRLFLGRPIPGQDIERHLVSGRWAIPVFAANALSSVAYAPQQILNLTGWSGAVGGLSYSGGPTTLGIAVAVTLLLAVVICSNRQMVFAYPNGGGCYIVTKDNLGAVLGLIAAAALLIDYVLTVCVSITSAVQNLAGLPSAYWMQDHLLSGSLLCCVFLVIVNLRGTRQAGMVSALPTYLFILCCFLMIFLGLCGPQLFGLRLHPKYINHDWAGPVQTSQKSVAGLGIIVLLRAFSQGSAMMTGIETVSNGIPLFKRPKSQHAAATLLKMGILLGTIFLGLCWLAVRFHVVYWEYEGKTADPVIDQLAGAVFGKSGQWSVGYYVSQWTTAVILFLTANTCLLGFPRLMYVLARDGYFPRKFTELNDRLVFPWGVLFLCGAAAALILLERGSVDALVPLYGCSVFLALTLSQGGMVRYWRRVKTRGWRYSVLINGIGAVTTGLICLVLFMESVWQGSFFFPVVIAGLALYMQIYARRHMPEKRPNKNPA